MNEAAVIPPPRVRIASHVTQTRFLHVEDALAIGKIRLFAGHYRRGQGMAGHGQHFIDLADARVIFAALAQAEPDFSYREYKGTPGPRGAGAISRVLSLAVKGDSVYLELKSGPGKLTATGAISPNGGTQVAINVGCKRYEARRLAATVLAYIQAWDVHRMGQQQQLVSRPALYLLAGTETTAAAVRVEPASATGASAESHHGRQAPTGNGPLVNMNGDQNAADRPVVPAAVKAAAATVYGAGELRYDDGTAVAAINVDEVQTFQRFVAEHKRAPASRLALQAYYRKRPTA